MHLYARVCSSWQLLWLCWFAVCEELVFATYLPTYMVVQRDSVMAILILAIYQNTLRLCNFMCCFLCGLANHKNAFCICQCLCVGRGVAVPSGKQLLKIAWLREPYLTVFWLLYIVNACVYRVCVYWMHSSTCFERPPCGSKKAVSQDRWSLIRGSPKIGIMIILSALKSFM